MEATRVSLASVVLLRAVCGLHGQAAAATLPRFSGAPPPWPYRGFDTFPSHFFGANESGLESADRLELAAKHHIAGWGWQQNYHTIKGNNGHYYQQETSLAQMASRLAAFLEFSPPRPERRTQAIFVYRHMEVAEFYFQVLAATYRDPANRDMFLHDAEGRVCWNTFDNTGPFFNFSSPQATRWFLDEVAGEILREANVQAVFFDETDYLYCGGPPGNCSRDVTDAEGWKAQYRAKIGMMRELAIKLNGGGIWPIYSSYNGFAETAYRKCVMPYDEYYTALHDVGWFRFYEYGIGARGPDPSWDSQAQLAQALKESELGQPVIVHAYPHQGQVTLPLALFLLVQNEWWYFGASTGWLEKDWHWWSEYDATYGPPLGPAKLSGAGWQRTFANCTVFVSSDLTAANITFSNGSSMVTGGPQILI